MRVPVTFYSYLKDVAGLAQTQLEMPQHATLGELFQFLLARFPRLRDMEKSILIAVGVEYQDPSYVLKPGDEVALFPPVQGG